MIKTQLLAAAAVARVISGSSLTEVLHDTWQKNASLSKQQRGAVQDISYGVLRFYGQLTTILDCLLKKTLSEEKLRYLLLVGLYQLQYSKTSPFTIVDQAVSASKSIIPNKAIQGLVNAVLRSFIRQRERLLQKSQHTDVGRYSYPQWWIDKLRSQYPQDYDWILQQGNLHPPMTLRVNRRKVSVQEYQYLLTKQGMASELLGFDAIRLTKPVAVEILPGFNDGWVTVQDIGAQRAAIYLDVQEGMRVLDACAAPGGKSTHLLELANIALTVIDSNSDRIKRIEQSLQRLQVSVDNIICADASKPQDWWDKRYFERILIDVPCSASGVVRRHPDIKWLRQEGDLAQLIKTQQAILNALWPLLLQGGKLLYVTCSIFREENAQQIETFLEQHEDAVVLSLPAAPFPIRDGQLLPEYAHDGFFYTLLQKK